MLTRAELSRQLRGQASTLRPRIKEHAWLDEERLAAVVQGSLDGRRLDQLVLFDRGRPVGEPVGSFEDLGGLKASPTGGRVAAFDRKRGAVVALDGAGNQIPLAVSEASGLAWSPDEEWIAAATEGAILVFQADEKSPEFIQIPLTDARDVLWEDLP